MIHSVYLALGSNLGDREANLQAALHALPPQVDVLARSPIYLTPPWGITDQPAFLNQTAQAATMLAPEALLQYLKKIERELGRIPGGRYGPRLIDLDILFYDNLILNKPGLSIPHPRLHERAFVLVPLADLAPDLRHPILGTTIAELAAAIDRSGVEVYSPDPAFPKTTREKPHSGSRTVNRLLLLMKTHTYRAGAFLDAAERLGVPVVIGSEQVHVMAAIQPDRHLALDFQDLEAATDSIIDFDGEHPLRAVLAPEDDGVLLAAMAADALQLSHNQVQSVAAARNKYLMRQMLERAGLPTPWYRRYPLSADPTEIASQVPYPNVVKPLSLSGSRGVVRADHPEQFRAAFARVVSILNKPEVAAQQGAMALHVLVEAYLPGIEVAVEGLLTGGKLQVLAIFDKPDPLEGPYFEETIYVTPSRLPAQQQAALIHTVAAGAEALGIVDGPVHAELRLNDDGIWLLEIAPRSIGGYCSRALRFDQGETLETLILRQALGQNVTEIKREKIAAGVMMIPIPQAGVLQEIRGQGAAGEVPGVDEIILAIPTGQRVLPLPDGNQYLGFIFARGGSPAEVEAALRAAHEHLEFVIQPADRLE